MFKNRNTAAIIIISALGYFVDVYDLILFSIVRIPSLKGIGILEDSAIMNKGVLLLNMQMMGMLIGGIIWGITGDKKGRISVLFGSIFLYSIANILNGFVNDVNVYAVLRFIAGIGLAGELGAGITLVSEVMPKETRGYGTMIVATVGLLGAVVASIIGSEFQWRTAFFIGGGMGFLLLILRIGVYESGMFKSVKDSNVSRGNILKLFSNKELFLKYLYCISIGVPIWFILGILITFSPEFAKEFKFTEPVFAGKAIMYYYIGGVAGDIASGSLSQIFKTRKKVIKSFIILVALSILVYLFTNKFGVVYFYSICVLLGISAGYWAVFITNASEQFGINIRATVTTTVPNIVRGAVVPATLMFQVLIQFTGIIYSALTVGFITVLFALISVKKLEETYGKDLNFLEES